MTKYRPKRKVEVVDLVANRAIQFRLLDALGKLGQIEGTLVATTIAFDPRAVRRRQLKSTLKPTAAQKSATRRVLARLKRAGLIVGVGRRRGLKMYRTAADADRLKELSLGPFE